MLKGQVCIGRGEEAFVARVIPVMNHLSLLACFLSAWQARGPGGRGIHEMWQKGGALGGEGEAEIALTF